MQDICDAGHAIHYNCKIFALRLFGFQGGLSIAKQLYKKPPPLIFIQFLSNLLLSCPRVECPLPCPAFLPCIVAVHLSSPLLVPPLLCLSAVARLCRRQHPCRTPELPSWSAPAEPIVTGLGVQFSTPEREGAGTSKAAAAHSPARVTETPPALTPAISMIQGPAVASISEEAQASEPPSKRYQTRVGPRPPSPVHPRPPQRAPPSKRARTSSPRESSRSKPEPSPPLADQISSPQLSPYTRITRPMFSCDPIPGNVNLRARDFHGESYYDIPALIVDQRFRDSMRLIQRYSLLPFMTLRQFFYSRVVLEFYHTMTSRGAPSQLQLQFSIDGRPGVLRAADITAALGLPVVLANSTDYRQWPHPSPREMVRSLARDTAAGPILFRRQLSSQMLLADHVLWTNLFPLQHYVQSRGAILEALYRISEGFWFSPAELVMTALLHFEEKVHRKDLARA